MPKLAERRIVLPYPMEHELPMLLSPARNKVLICGRRWGKDKVGLIAAVEGHGPQGKWRGALDGGEIWWLAPDYPMSRMMWRDLVYSLRDAWEDKSEQEMRITLPGGGAVQIKSTSDPDSLRGPRLDGVILNEASLQEYAVWHEAVRPALSDSGGWAMFLSTVKGESWLWDVYDLALTTPGWEAWIRPTSDNPLITKEELEQARREMGEALYRQEYECDRFALGLVAFSDFSRAKHVIPYRELPETWRRIAGHDWGSNAPGHHLWGAIDPEGGVIIYRELSFRHLDPHEIAQAILFHQGQEKITTVWADPSIWRESGRAYLNADQIRHLAEGGKLQLTLASQYEQAGFYSQPANNARIAGKNLIQRLLGDRGDGVPYLRIMETCPILIKTLQGIQVDPSRAEDVLTDYLPDARLRDDAYDALRYLLMGLPTSLTPPKAEVRGSTQWTWGSGRGRNGRRDYATFRG